MKETDQYYQVLGLKPGASEEEITRAYKILTKTWYPQRSSEDQSLQEIAREKLKEIEEAYIRLMTPVHASLDQEDSSLVSKLEIKSEPTGAKIYINGGEVGETPLILPKIHSGQYTIRVVKEGFNPSEGKVQIIPGERRALNAHLKKMETHGSIGPLPVKFFKDPYLGMEFVYVKGGRFEMGDIFGGGKSDETPVHWVRVDGFWIGKYPVTQGQWKTIMGDNPSLFKSGDNYPVERVSWYNAEEFIKRLNKKTGMKYRLPTEAEWEYAARAEGKEEMWAGANLESEIGECGWCWFNSDSKTHPVGQKKPNSLGLYDMSGNVWEWVQDGYDRDYYKNSPRDNPLHSGYGESKVIRGGSWQSGPMPLRTINRNSRHPLEIDGVGFRLALSAKGAPVVMKEIHSTQQNDAFQSGTESMASQPDHTNLDSTSYVSLQPTVHRDEGPVDGQSVRPAQGGLGVGAKVGLTVMVVLIGGMIFGLISNIVGHGHAIWAGILALIIFYIWSRPGRAT